MVSKKKNAKWMWYYGDFELYHSIKLHSRRQEFGMDFPPFWGLSNVYPIVRFRKEIVLENDDEIFVKLKGKGRVRIDDEFYTSDTKISVKAGKRTIEITVINDKGLPSAFVSGNDLVSDETWEVSLCSNDYVKVGCEPAFTNVSDDLENFPFVYEKILPVSVERVNGGILYDFGKETFGYINIDGMKNDFTVYYGESKEEALSGNDAILFEKVFAKPQIKLRQRAFRYVFLSTDETPENIYSVTVFINLSLALFLANVMSKKIVGKKFWLVLFFLPQVCSSISTTLMWKWLLNENGVVNTILGAFGVEPIHFFTDSKYYMIAIFIMSAWQHGTNIVVLLSAFSQINVSLQEAARLDGATEMRVFWKITFPQLTPTIYYLLTMNLITALQEQAIFQFLNTTGVGPDFWGLTLTYQMYRLINVNYQYGTSCALSWIIGIFIMIVTSINSKLSEKWVSYD